MDYTVIFELGMKLLWAIIVLIVAPAIAKYVNLKRYMKYIKIAVHAAEQMYTKEQWAEKRQHVLTYLEGMGIKLDEDTVIRIMEAYVLALHQAMEGKDVPPILP